MFTTQRVELREEALSFERDAQKRDPAPRQTDRAHDLLTRRRSTGVTRDEHSRTASVAIGHKRDFRISPLVLQIWKRAPKGLEKVRLDSRRGQSRRELSTLPVNLFECVRDASGELGRGRVVATISGNTARPDYRVRRQDR
jgi:hypothetical protein